MENTRNPTTSALVKQLVAAESAFERNEAGAREKLLELTYKLEAAVQLPSESIQRMGWAEPARLALCRVAVDLKIFETLKASGHAMDSKELAKSCKADATLTERLLRHLAAMNVIAQDETGKFSATALSDAYTEQQYSDGIKYVHEIAGPSFHQMPAYFEKIHYTHPTSLTDGPFQHAHQTNLPFFGYLAQNPANLAMFSNYMSAYRAGRPGWADKGFYPIQEQLVSKFNESMSHVLLVDVGGGKGHDLAELKAKHKDLPGGLVLQDQESVVSQIDKKDLPGVEVMAHDFFTPQPVINARAYFLHSVLHDWGDDDCVKILSNLKTAMKGGYSSILLYEIAVPERGASWSVTSMDWLMMALGAVRERTISEWRALVERSGLAVGGVWSYDGVAEVIIEAISA